jgi:hypothetical protein
MQAARVAAMLPALPVSAGRGCSQRGGTEAGCGCSARTQRRPARRAGPLGAATGGRAEVAPAAPWAACERNAGRSRRLRREIQTQALKIEAPRPVSSKRARAQEGVHAGGGKAAHQIGKAAGPRCGKALAGSRAALGPPRAGLFVGKRRVPRLGRPRPRRRGAAAAGAGVVWGRGGRGAGAGLGLGLGLGVGLLWLVALVTPGRELLL